MDFLAHIPVRAIDVLLAAACVVAGGPLFAAGLRALRLRRSLGALRERPLDGDAVGLVLVRGKVSLEGLLFAPLSGRPCAGYELSVRGERSRVGGTLREMRAFLLSAGDSTVRIDPARAHWTGSITAERTLSPAESLPVRLAELLDASAELRWLRDRRVPLHMVERAIEPGMTVHVAGVGREVVVAVANTVEVETLAATGTDGPGLVSRYTDRTVATATTEVWIGADETLDPVILTPEPPNLASMRPPAWRVGLVALGPAMAVCGLLYLAHAAAPLIGARF